MSAAIPIDFTVVQARLATLWLPRLQARRRQILEALAEMPTVRPATYFHVEDATVPVLSGRGEAAELARLRRIGITLLSVDPVTALRLKGEARPWNLGKLEATLAPGHQALHRSVEQGLFEGKIFEPYAELTDDELAAFVAEWRRRHDNGSMIPSALIRVIRQAKRRRLKEFLPRPGPA